VDDKMAAEIVRHYRAGVSMVDIAAAIAGVSERRPSHAPRARHPDSDATGLGDPVAD
jgi:hypothetical protein